MYHYLTISFITITFTFHRHVCLAEKNTTPGSIGPRATTLGLKPMKGQHKERISSVLSGPFATPVAKANTSFVTSVRLSVR